MAKLLSEMTIEELEAEFNAWCLVTNQPKGPGTTSTLAREYAVEQQIACDGWIARRVAEQRAKER